MSENHHQTTLPEQPVATSDPPQDVKTPERPKEYGGPKGLEPTRYGDWEKAGRCIDF
jgi:shikimate dehydrogenase